MKPNQQEKCAHKKNLGESCSQCNEAWNDMTSPHQEGWAERFVRSFCDDHGTDDKYKYFDGATIPRDIIAFIRQELTTLHKADCERFRRLIESEKKNYDGFWQEIENMGKNANRHGPSSQAKVDGKEAFSRLLITALSKMEGEV